MPDARVQAEAWSEARGDGDPEVPCGHQAFNGPVVVSMLETYRIATNAWTGRECSGSGPHSSCGAALPLDRMAGRMAGRAGLAACSAGST